MRINFSINIGVEFYIKETGINKNFYYKTSGVAEKGRKKKLNLSPYMFYYNIPHIIWDIIIVNIFCSTKKK